MHTTTLVHPNVADWLVMTESPSCIQVNTISQSCLAVEARQAYQCNDTFADQLHWVGGGSGDHHIAPCNVAIAGRYLCSDMNFSSEHKGVNSALHPLKDHHISTVVKGGQHGGAYTLHWRSA